jgi:cyclophilin family peptidyl-prolyl cis-trans isomerase
MVALANSGFFRNTVFHRIVPGFVIQGGDPTGTGTGGPGYKTVDKPDAGTAYTKGVVAMAKGGPEAAGTAGSQFYVVTGEDAGLPPDYAVIGKVTKGQDVVDRIGKLGGPDEQPTQVVELIDVKASSS